MAVYYNDADPAACAWLRDLIAAGLLPPGEVDERSILEVEPADLRGFAQCHFFAGIGGWPHALRLAGGFSGGVRAAKTYRVAQGADPLDARFKHIAWPHEFRRLAAGAGVPMRPPSVPFP
jgi:hypothetical protein